jgi:hypothetical protein
VSSTFGCVGAPDASRGNWFWAGLEILVLSLVCVPPTTARLPPSFSDTIPSSYWFLGRLGTANTNCASMDLG